MYQYHEIEKRKINGDWRDMSTRLLYCSGNRCGSSAFVEMYYYYVIPYSCMQMILESTLGCWVWVDDRINASHQFNGRRRVKRATRRRRIWNKNMSVSYY